MENVVYMVLTSPGELGEEWSGEVKVYPAGESASAGEECLMIYRSGPFRTQKEAADDVIAWYQEHKFTCGHRQIISGMIRCRVVEGAESGI